MYSGYIYLTNILNCQKPQAVFRGSRSYSLIIGALNEYFITGV